MWVVIGAVVVWMVTCTIVCHVWAKACEQRDIHNAQLMRELRGKP